MRQTAIALSILALALNCCSSRQSILVQNDSTTYDKGVVINGVKWATRNVDEFGKFAPTPESPGKLYQWNRKKAWNTTDKEVENWIDSTPEGTAWEKANDPCPAGWRLPTLHEFDLLADAENSWTAVNTIYGRRFGSGDSTIFLPAAGYFSSINGLTGRLNDTGRLGYYWSSTEYNATRAHSLMLLYAFVDKGGVGAEKKEGYCIRCVSE